MSISTSNLGYQMEYDYDRPIRMANYHNQISRQLQQDRLNYNGEIMSRVLPKTNQHQTKMSNVVGGRGQPPSGKSRRVTNGGTNVSQPISTAKLINRNKYNVITGQPNVYNDALHQAYMIFLKHLQMNKGMANPVQNPHNNWPSKKYIKV